MSDKRKIERRVECCLCDEVVPQSQAYDLSIDPCIDNNGVRYYDHFTGERVFGPVETYGYLCGRCAQKLDYIVNNWHAISWYDDNGEVPDPEKAVEDD